VTRLILLRHGQTEWNVANRFQGQTDIELSPAGHDQAAAIAGRLAAERPDAMFSSDLLRCAATAAPLAALTGLAVTQDIRLRERGYGDWEGLTRPEVEAGWPTELARWSAGQPLRGANIEEAEDVGKRMAAVLTEIAGTHAGATVVVVTHGGAARHGVAAMLGWADELARTLGGLSNCHYSELRLRPSGGWTLSAHNIGAEPTAAR
jgi:broad specificity phosphatase PhoE